MTHTNSVHRTAPRRAFHLGAGLLALLLSPAGCSDAAEHTSAETAALVSGVRTQGTMSVLNGTTFNASIDGFQFINDFQNIFGPVETSGLCGGMSYAALDYFNAKMTIPQQSYRPEENTPLQSYIYGRQESSIENNLGTWTGWGVNPLGVNNGAIVANSLGQQVDTVVASINAGKPIPLGLDGTNGSGGHQVLAIGYALGSSRSGIQIYLYNPNYPGRQVTLVFNTTAQVFTIAEDSMRDQWTGFYADTSYSALTPPSVPEPVYPNDGLVHELFIQVATGNNALQNGANAALEIGLTNGSVVTLSGLNLGEKWVPNYTETVRSVLPTPLDPSTIKSVTLSKTTSCQPWDVTSTLVQAVGSGTWELAKGAPTQLGCSGQNEALWLVQLPPTIIKVSPQAAPAGATVTISGTGFHTDGSTQVTFGSTRATATCPSTTTCNAIVPAGAGTVALTLTEPVLGYSTALAHPPAPLQTFSVGGGLFAYPPPPPGCAPVATCSAQSGASQKLDTITVTSSTCTTTPSSMEELVNGAWVTVSPFAANPNNPVQNTGVYNLQGAVGSTESVRACSTTNSGTTCDAAVNLTVPNCCVPLTCAGSCGTMSDGCGGTLSCGGCAAGLVCSNYNQCEKCAVTLTCGPGHYFSETTCSCVADSCACGGVYPNCRVCQ